jgi:uncharacterized protein
MRHLCDSNVFLALTASGHRHHAATRAWFQSLTRNDTAEFCRMTQVTFLRLLTTEAVMGEYAVANDQAISLYGALLRHDRVRFAELEPVGMEKAWHSAAASRQTAPKRWMDAYLAAFSRLAGMRLVTFDRGFRQYEADGLDLQLLI